MTDRPDTTDLFPSMKPITLFMIVFLAILAADLVKGIVSVAWISVMLPKQAPTLKVPPPESFCARRSETCRTVPNSEYCRMTKSDCP